MQFLLTRHKWVDAESAGEESCENEDWGQMEKNS